MDGEIHLSPYQSGDSEVQETSCSDYDSRIRKKKQKRYGSARSDVSRTDSEREGIRPNSVGPIFIDEVANDNRNHEGDHLLPPKDPGCMWSLIPGCCIRKWKYCRLVYTVALCTCLIVTLGLLSVAIWWASVMFKLNSKVLFASYRGTYLIKQDSYHFDSVCFHQDYEQLILTATRYNCSIQTQRISNRLPPIRTKKGILFNWLRDTSFSVTYNTTAHPFLILANQSPDLQDYYELCNNNNRGSGFTCSPPSDSEIQCNITEDNSYYLCLNSNSNNEYQYEVIIDEIQYDLQPENRLSEPVLNIGCVNYSSNIFEELHHTTCIFVTTNATNSDDNRSQPHDIMVTAHARSDVIVYFSVMLFALAVLFITLSGFCYGTKYKKDHPDTKGCDCYCSCYGRVENERPQEQEDRV